MMANSLPGDDACQVAIVHDYLTQRGGAERVVLSMVRAFPGAPVYTSLFDPRRTYAEFEEVDVRVSNLNRIPLLSRNHRLALPVLAPTFSRMQVRGDIVLCSSSGWAHGIRTAGRRVVYAYAPARWLYQKARYLRGKSAFARAGLAMLRPYLLRWDQRAARQADLYLTSSTTMQEALMEAYGIRAELLPPPVTIRTDGDRKPPAHMEPGYFLCVSRLLPYKNVDALIKAFRGLPRERLVVVGTGPEDAKLRAMAVPNVRFLGAVTDQELRWLYENARGLLAASFEDFGLTPLEAAAFGTPSVVLQAGGFLDTVREGETGLFFDDPTPEKIQNAVQMALNFHFDQERLRRQAARYSESNFIDRLRAIVLAVSQEPVWHEGLSRDTRGRLLQDRDGG